MPLSPIDVQQQTFKVALRGYAEDEVDEFLDEVVISLRDYEQRLRDAQERVAVLEEQLSANRETEDAMRRTFLAAQRTADAIVEEAKSESERLMADAHGEVERVMLGQTEEKAHLLAETALLRDRVHGLRASLADLAGGTLERLDELDVDATADRIAATAAPVQDLREIERETTREPMKPPYEPEASRSGDEGADDRWDAGIEELEDENEDRDGSDVESADDEVAVEDVERPAEGFEHEDEDEDEDEDRDVEVAKVPDWMTRDDSDSPEPQREFRRPWERDDR
ncbi:MAG: DivIVA domain-containing protein [Acidimicrobiia bacterium]|nr:DivIVA domain-containing protein [Acidimicrobiia bacterium]